MLGLSSPGTLSSLLAQGLACLLLQSAGNTRGASLASLAAACPQLLPLFQNASAALAAAARVD